MLDLVYRLVCATKDAATDDGDGNCEADKGENAREDQFLAESNPGSPQDDDGKA